MLLGKDKQLYCYYHNNSFVKQTTTYVFKENKIRNIYLDEVIRQ